MGQPTEPDRSAADRVFEEWNRAFSENDVEALLRLYHPDAVLESPLIPYLLGSHFGVCRGQLELRRFFDLMTQRKPHLRRYYRPGYLTDGRTLMFEYPRVGPEGEQMDFVDVLELEAGLIRLHKIYWGWRAFEVIKADEYH
jgi:hypothetical protein